MSILFLSDPHLGLLRTANTTPASRMALQYRLEEHLGNVIEEHGGSEGFDDPARSVICGGDMFDKYSNDEEVIMRAAPLYKRLDYCIAGNHDVVNIAGKEGSLALLDSMYPGITSFNDIGRNSWFRQDFGMTAVFSIPHVATQQLFEIALGTLLEVADTDPFTYNICLLHCNYNIGFDDPSDATLNLTTEMAEKLVEKFDYVLLGHEHIPADHLGGKLKIIGNLHPTGFSDISDKRVLIWNDGMWEEKEVWSEYHATEAPWDYGHWDDVLDEVQFLRITGECEATDMKGISATVKGLWRNSPNLFAIKLDVKIKGIEATTDIEHMDIESLPTIIAKELDGKPEGKLWDELSGGD